LLHRGLQGLSIVLPTHTGGNLFSIVLQSRAFIGALPRLFPFPRRHIVCATSFLSFGNKKVQTCLQKGRSIMLMTVQRRCEPNRATIQPLCSSGERRSAIVSSVTSTIVSVLLLAITALPTINLASASASASGLVWRPQ
jgi:hypothetical protein